VEMLWAQGRMKVYLLGSQFKFIVIIVTTFVSHRASVKSTTAAFVDQYVEKGTRCVVRAWQDFLLVADLLAVVPVIGDAQGWPKPCTYLYIYLYIYL
jgi:hypothetical protein